MDKIRIPFNKPTLVGNEFRYIEQAISSGHISGDGLFSRKCQELIENITGTQKCLLTTSCTHALEMTALLLELQPEDEVITPSFTFVSTVTAFVLRGARPVFADIRPDTLNINEENIESLISSKTRAIVVVHYGGVACEMDKIQEIASRHNLAIIEDNAHGFLGKYNNRSLGTIGCLATQSFHETKNLFCGEGGALLVNDEQYTERAEIIRDKGTNRSRYFRGEVDKYTWVDTGSSYVLSDLLAAFLYAQVSEIDLTQEKRKTIWNQYHSELGDWAKTNKVQIQKIPENCKSAYHLFCLILPSQACREKLIGHLKKEGILSAFHYQPLHQSSMGKKWGIQRESYPVTERMGDCLLRLPFYNNLSRSDQEEVISSIKNFRDFSPV